MIEANELRIGNYYYNQHGHLNQTTTISKYKDLGVNHDLIQPIPLTEEWLLKFGFEMLDHAKRYGEGFVSAHGWRAKYSIDGLRILQPSEKSNWANKQNSFSIIGLSDVNLWIDYVHQLQNLYFALTNEELTIK
jgi:hypothetical protein